MSRLKWAVAAQRSEVFDRSVSEYFRLKEQNIKN